MSEIIINGKTYNSYATVEEANNYFGAKFGSTWENIEDTDKAKLLVTATREIDKFRFKGFKVELEQPLAFPRLLCCYTINPTDELIACCCEVANTINEVSLSATVITPNADKIKSMSVGDTSVTFKDGATIDIDAFSSVANPIIKKMLGHLISGNIKVLL